MLVVRVLLLVAEGYGQWAMAYCCESPEGVGVFCFTWETLLFDERGEPGNPAVSDNIGCISWSGQNMNLQQSRRQSAAAMTFAAKCNDLGIK